MKLVSDRPFADPDAAARKLVDAGRPSTAATTVLLRRNISVWKINRPEATSLATMSIEHDHRAEAEAATTMAAAATCEIERLKWLRVALAWRALTRDHEWCAGRAVTRNANLAGGATEEGGEGIPDR